MDDGPASSPALPLVISSDPAPRQPPLPDPSSSSAPSKRRWSPSTWRYAIEEVQPELGSKPRSSHILSASSALLSERERAPAPEPPAKWAPADRAGDGLHGGCSQISARQISGRESSEKAGARKKQGQHEAELAEERMGRAKKKKNRERRVEDSCSKRREREMTPSELYFCDECAQERSNGSGSSPVGDCG